MFKKFLVSTDGSQQSAKAIRGAVELARQVGGTLVGVAVVEPYPFPPVSDSPFSGGSPAYEQRALALAQEHVDSVAHAAAEARVPCETVVVHGLYPYQEIIAVADSKKCDAILMATHGRKGVSKLLVGSETQKVIAHSDVPVMVFP